ncbi:MAG TPA: DUF3618 domain-containing protein [Allosphingosinicella sp.]|nr:DUF3618 domain-containing protein [Allosphingosinicella sp.]
MSKDNKDKKDASLVELERAKLEAELAKKRLTATMSTLQERLRPGALANEAWTGVREKGGEIADNTMQKVKDRPAAAGGVLAALLVYLARDPLWAAVTKLFRGQDDQDLVTTKVSRKDKNYDLAAPPVSRSVDEGVSA